MISIKAFALGPLETNCYLVHNGSVSVVIDPGGDPAEVVDFLRGRKLDLEAVLNTHLHFDHIQGNAALGREFSVKILASSEDDYLLDTEVGGGGFMGFPLTPKFEHENLLPGEYEFAGNTCQVLATPGHSPGSLSFYFPEAGVVFSGDLVFFRSIGRTDFPGGDQDKLVNSAREKILSLPPDTIIYPGHGPETRVKDEELHNPFFSRVWQP
jgi:glyoxylase-like metal-dependent hydrolase (beta-lactamase superfamily II)